MAELNLKIGDPVYYGAHGVCRVCGREQKEYKGGSRDYFILRPVGEEHIMLYLPVDAAPEKVKLRSVMSAAEIISLVEKEMNHEAEWIADSKIRRETCSKVLRGGDATELIRMVKGMYLHEKQLPEGKSLAISDLEIMRAAERQLYNEFHYSLNMEKGQLLPFLMGEYRISAAEHAVS